MSKYISALIVTLCASVFMASHSDAETVKQPGMPLHSFGLMTPFNTGDGHIRLAQGITPSCPQGYHFSKGKCQVGAAPKSAAPVPPRVAPQAAPQVAPRQPQPVAQPPLSPKVQAYVDRWYEFVVQNGIDRVAPHRFSVPSCPGCVPYLVNCKNAVSTVAGLRGLRLRVSPDGMKFAERVGGTPVLLPGGEITIAMDSNTIDCAIAGGVVPR